VQNDFGIARRLENVPTTLELLANRWGVHQVAVVRQRHLALLAAHRQRLGILQVSVTCGGITCVTDGGVPRQAIQYFLGENLSNVAHPLVSDQLRAIGGGDACAFLPTMLESMKAQVG
jgi:predicted GNAT family acetyltransferase